MSQIEIVKTKMMSSKSIAEKTGKSHGNVLRDIRNMLSEIQDSNLNPSDYKVVTGENSMTSEIFLNERLSLLLSSGYSIKLRLMIIDAWAELKAQGTQIVIPQTLSEALMLAANLAKENEEQKMALNEARPKVEYFNRVASADTTFDLSEVAKNLKLPYGRNTLFKTLRGRGVLMEGNVPYQKYVDARYFEVNQTSYKTSDGKIHIVLQTRVTDKGMKWLAKNLN